MGNSYQGTKFRTDLNRQPLKSDHNTDALIYWCHKIAQQNCAPAMPGGFGGNLSCRLEEGFLITASGADLAKLELKEIVKVIAFDQDKLYVQAEGLRLPSSESLLHAAIYQARPEVKAVFHGHYPVKEAYFIKQGLPVTERETPYGSRELIEEVQKILGNHNFVLMKNHGFLSLSDSPQSAGNQVLSICQKVKETIE